MWIVVGVLPGLDHALLHDPAEPHVERRAQLAQWLAGSAGGVFFDGAWGVFTDSTAALLAALSATETAALACRRIACPVGDPPLGLEPLWAHAASRSVRVGEIAVLRSEWSAEALPVGVARSAAPSGLMGSLGAVDLIRDYRSR